MRYYLFIPFLLHSLCSLADPSAYNKIVELKTESENLLVIHYHDWSLSTNESRYEMISTHQNPFDQSNDYSYILCVNKHTNDTIFKSPSPALTELKISEDEKYIVGLSHIMVWNPYHFVLFESSGILIKKRHISSIEAKLTKNQYEKFKYRFVEQNNFLDSLDRIHAVNDHIYIDFVSMGMPTRLGDAWDYLMRFYSTNHLSENFSESVTNWVFWYLEKNPNIIFEYDNASLVTVSLLDPQQKRINIKI